MGAPAVDAEPVVLWRALAVARAVLFAYAVAVNAVNDGRYAHPVAVWAVLGALGAWTCAAPWLYASATRRPALVFAECALAGAAQLVTPWVEGDTARLYDTPSVPSFWIAAPVLASAILWEWRGGLVAAAAQAGIELVVRGLRSDTTVSNIFLLVLAGLVVGYLSALVRTSARDRADAVAARAAAAERERLARVVHDGVLQTLAYVQRRGAEIGGEAAELAALAGEQEAALRGLVSGTGAADGPRQRDVAALLHLHAGRAVSVATPGVPVPLPAHAAEELVAAVRAALDNTSRHAAGATAYVLLEDDGAEVVVSVGDDGPGIPDGRLDEAAAAGRMGVTTSIRSRLSDLGGTAVLTTGPGRGTEWELRVPR